MKATTILCLALLFYYSTSAQTEIGKIETYNEEIISIYSYPPDKKVLFSPIVKGCDCMLQKGKIFYHTTDGKHKKVSQSNVKKLTLNDKAVYCKTTGRGSMGINNTHGKSNYQVKLAGSMSFIGLPIKKKRKKTLLHKILYTGDKYMISVMNQDEEVGQVYIFETATHQLVSGPYDYPKIGYGKRGKKAYTQIQKYFSDSPKLIESMERIKIENAKVRLSQRKPLLNDIHFIHHNTVSIPAPFTHARLDGNSIPPFGH